MLVLVGICVVVATLAVVATAVVAIRALHGLEKVGDEVSKLPAEIHLWIGEARALTGEARETTASLRSVIDPIGRVTERFEILGQRTADVTDALLDEAKQPLRVALAVTDGVRSVAAWLLKHWSQRVNHGRSATRKG